MSQKGEIRVAICDDHPIFCAGLRDLLRGEPGLALVFEAHSLAELAAIPLDPAPDVVLLDVSLPDGSGIEALPTLAPHSRVVLLSAHDDARTIKRAFELGAAGFLRKDTVARDLLSSVKRAAAGEPVLTADQALAITHALRDDSERGRFHKATAQLSARQKEVLALLARGHSNREIGRALFVSEGTVKNHVTQLLRAFETSDRTRLALLVGRYGLEP